MSYATQRLTALSKLRNRISVEKSSKDPTKEAPPTVAKAGIEVQTSPEPKHGVFEHSLAGQKIGHTVKAVANGSIAWTAVPTNGNINGKFKSQEDAKQYLADQHAEGMKQAVMEEQLANKNAGAKPVRKDDEEVGDESASEAGEITKLDEQNESGESADDVEKSHKWTHFGPGGKRIPMSEEHKAKFEANKFVAKLDAIEDSLIRIQKDWGTWDDARKAASGGSTRAAARAATYVALGEGTVSGHQKAIQYHEEDKAAQLKDEPDANVRYNDRMIALHKDAIAQLKGESK